MHCKICGDWTCEKIEDRHSLVAYSTEEDVDGFFHYHDLNYRYQIWKCSKGHEFRCGAPNICWCGWSSRFPNEIFHENKLIDPEKQPKCVKFSQNRLILNPEYVVNMKFNDKEP